MRTNIERVIQRLEEIYACGRQPDGTFTRMAFSPEDQAGRDLFAQYFRQLEIPVHLDPAGNLIARMPGQNPDLPAIVMGSHLDTVPDGGKYDGVLGCVAGLEVCQAIKESGLTTDHPLEVVVFTDEEGFRFADGLVGSTAFCGDPIKLKPDDLDILGQERADVYKAFGIDLDKLDQAKRDPETIHCCLELHVEQGSNLDKKALPVGVVSTIAGVRRMELGVAGEANHSGSTRMCDRRDALVAAATFISQIPNWVSQVGDEYTVATVGVIGVEPAAVNVIPGKCSFTLEIRDRDDRVMAALADRLQAEFRRIAQEQGVEVEIRDISNHQPMPMNSDLQQIIISQAEKMDLAHLVVPSGAFHDSLLLAGHYPTAMIFVASEKGLSHCREEYSRPEDIGKGVELLLETVLAADKVREFKN